MFIVRQTYVIQNINGVNYRLCEFECDSVSDLPAQAQTGWNVMTGSKAHVIDTNSWYAIKSTGAWVLQNANGTAGYTKEEVDQLIQDTKDYADGEILGAINDLDVPAVGGSTKYIYSISQADGLIYADAYTSDSSPTTGSTKLVQSGGVKTYVDTADTALQTAIDGKATLSQVFGAGNGLSSGTDLNNIKTIGRYYWGAAVASGLANSPISTYTLLSTEPADWESAYNSKYFEKYTEPNTGKERYRFVQGDTAPTFVANTFYKCSGAGGTLTVENIQGSSRVRQTFVENDTLAKSGRYFVRFFVSSYSGTWSSWFMFEGTEVV